MRKKSKKICFVLDLIPLKPMGGVKIIFKYANHFAEEGNDVRIVFSSNFLGSLKRYIPYRVRKGIVQLYLDRGPSWFKLNKKIKRICVDCIDDKNIPNGDIIFATAVTTAEGVSRLSCNKGKKYYLIQDYESWAKGEDYVEKTYCLGMNNITISDWLYDKVKTTTNVSPTIIRNPIDTQIFRMTINPHNRNPHSITMICQNDERKGFVYGLKAICRVKELIPDTKCIIFGIGKRRKDIPQWIAYKQNASEKELVEIYNNSAVFLCSSISEGYGLCGAESMACGCALVSTAYAGVYSYAKNETNALLSPIKDIDKLKENIIRLFNDNDLRIKLAFCGYESIQKTSWENAYKLMNHAVGLQEGEIENEK